MIFNDLIHSTRRLELAEAHSKLESTKTELTETKEELLLTRCQLSNSDAQVIDAERRLEQLRRNR